MFVNFLVLGMGLGAFALPFRHAEARGTPLVPAAPAVASPAASRAASPAHQALTPCAPGDPERLSAEQELDAISAAIGALGIAEDPAPLAARLKALTDTRCFEMVGALELTPTSGLSLKTYWQEGGEDTLRGYLNLGAPGDQRLWLEPTMRRALTLETDGLRSPVRELLCPFADSACGAETRGWALRAEQMFRALAPRNEESKDDTYCRKRALEAAPRARFARFRDCETESRTPHAALPVGATRALKRGWLIVSGRRGHYSFCDETRAYDLATGSAYRVASCSALALQDGGSVDFRTTDALRRTQVELGHLPLAALREAAWMLLMLDSIDRDVVESAGVSIPKKVPLTVETTPPLRLIGFSQSWTSADTELEWRIESPDPQRPPLKRGTLTWSPSSLDDAPSEHAVTLLRVAEASPIPGCPEIPPPSTVVQRSLALSADHLDADSTSLNAAEKTLRAQWEEARARQRACAASSSSASAPSH